MTEFVSKTSSSVLEPSKLELDGKYFCGCCRTNGEHLDNFSDDEANETHHRKRMLCGDHTLTPSGSFLSVASDVSYKRSIMSHAGVENSSRKSSICSLILVEAVEGFVSYKKERELHRRINRASLYSGVQPTSSTSLSCYPQNVSLLSPAHAERNFRDSNPKVSYKSSAVSVYVDREDDRQENTDNYRLVAPLMQTPQRLDFNNDENCSDESLEMHNEPLEENDWSVVAYDRNRDEGCHSESSYYSSEEMNFMPDRQHSPERKVENPHACGRRLSDGDFKSENDEDDDWC